MTLFHCRALNPSGQVVEETREGDSLDAIVAGLEGAGYTPLSVQERAAPVARKGVRLFRSRTWAPRDLAVFSRQLATMLAAAVSIDEGLNTLASHARPEHESVLRSLSQSVRRGESFSDALSHFPGVFPATYVATVAASETVGKLDTSLVELADVLDWESALARDVRGALQYPATVLFAIVVAMIVLQQVVVPQFSNFFARFESDLPLPTTILFLSADLISGYWWAMLLGAGAGVFCFRKYTATASGRFQYHRGLIRIPVIGTLIHRMHLARFARMFSLLQSSGLPILNTLELMERTTGNAVISRQIVSVRDEVSRGESLGEAVAHNNVFTPIVVSMIRIGENSGRLDSSLNMVARYYEEETRAALRDLTRWIEPVLTVVLGAFVLFLALAIFLPWWDMTQLYKK